MEKGFYYVLYNVEYKACDKACYKMFKYQIISAYNRNQIKEWVEEWTEHFPAPCPEFKSYDESMRYIFERGKRLGCNYFDGKLINLTD